MRPRSGLAKERSESCQSAHVFVAEICAEVGKKFLGHGGIPRSGSYQLSDKIHPEVPGPPGLVLKPPGMCASISRRGSTTTGNNRGPSSCSRERRASSHCHQSSVCARTPWRDAICSASPPRESSRTLFDHHSDVCLDMRRVHHPATDCARRPIPYGYGELLEQAVRPRQILGLRVTRQELVEKLTANVFLSLCRHRLSFLFPGKTVI